MDHHMKILLVLTGGTIGSEPGQYGLQPSSTEKQADLIQGLLSSTDISDIDFLTIQPVNILSEVMHPNDWSAIIHSIAENAKDTSGILVVHGTDTLGYTSAAISYAESLSKKYPIIITGANYPVEHTQSDAKANIIQSVYALRHLIDNKIKGVYVVYNGSKDVASQGKIFLGSRVKKRSWNNHCYHNFNIGEKEWIGVVNKDNSVALDDATHYEMPNRSIYPSIDTSFNSKAIDFFKIAPGWNLKSLTRALHDRDIKYILLEIYNSGTAPTSGTGSIIEQLTLAQYLGKTIFAVSQHEGVGGMTLDCYETSQILKRSGVISLKDMMWENAIPKLMLAAANFDAPEQVINFMLTNIAGEISN